MAPHSSTLAWKIPWMEEPGRLQSMGSLGVRHNWATSHSLFTFMQWRRKWQPTPVHVPGESQGQGSLVAAIYGVAQSWTLLKQLSSSRSSKQLTHTYTWRLNFYLSYCIAAERALASLVPHLVSNPILNEIEPLFLCISLGLSVRCCGKTWMNIWLT